MLGAEQKMMVEYIRKLIESATKKLKKKPNNFDTDLFFLG